MRRCHPARQDRLMPWLRRAAKGRFFPSLVPSECAPLKNYRPRRPSRLALREPARTEIQSEIGSEPYHRNVEILDRTWRPELLGIPTPIEPRVARCHHTYLQDVTFPDRVQISAAGPFNR
jgi:hypothetical protein